MSYLVLVRHGESTWNKAGAWTGLTDISLDEEGKKKAKQDGLLLKDIKFDIAYTSKLRRAQQSLAEIKKGIGALDLPVMENAALNERDYGDFTGKEKKDLKKEYGEEQFLKWRRGWDEKIPNGETLKDVYNRVIPFYQSQILPELKNGKNVLVVAHGNSLRALVKFLDNISDEDIAKTELELGEIDIYQIDKDGKVVSKEIKNI